MGKDKDAHFDDREKKGLKLENEGPAGSRKAAIGGRGIKASIFKNMSDDKWSKGGGKK